jgi:hypothetical protein
LARRVNFCMTAAPLLSMRMDPKHIAALRDRFAAFEGTWDGEEAIALAPHAPGVAARARHVMRRVVDGAVLVQAYEQRRADGAAPIAGHGVFAVDPSEGDLTWFFFDNLGFVPDAPARGGWQAGELVVGRSTRRGEARYRFRVDGRRLLHRIETKPAGAAEFTLFLSGTYLRTGP